MSKSIEITCNNCHGLLRLVEVPKQDHGDCPDCGYTIDLKEYLPGYVQESFRENESFFDDVPVRRESVVAEVIPDPILADSSPQDDLSYSVGLPINDELDTEIDIALPSDDALPLQSDFSSKQEEVDNDLKVDPEEVESPKEVYTERSQQDQIEPVQESVANLSVDGGFANKLEQMESDLNNLIKRNSMPLFAEEVEEKPQPTKRVESFNSVNSISASNLIPQSVVPTPINVPDALVEKNQHLKQKLDTLDAVHQQLRSEHVDLSNRFRSLEEEKRKIENLQASGASNFLTGAVNNDSIVNYEKEKNKVLKQKWQESLLQLKRSESHMQQLATQLLEKEGQLKEREQYVSTVRLEKEQQLSELEKQGERIRQEAETRKAFEQKIFELTKEVEALKEAAEHNEQSRLQLESLLREREAEILQQKHSFTETQNKINVITQEIVEREQSLATQLLELEAARAELEADATDLEREKSNLKQLVAELNQRLADVQESEEKIAKDLKDQEIYNNAFANERAELEQIRNDILLQKQEIESSKSQLVEKNAKVTEIQNLLLSEKQAFDADRMAWDIANEEKLVKEHDLKLSENELTIQKVKLNETERLLSDKEAELTELAQQLGKKEEALITAQGEIQAKKDELTTQEEQISATHKKLKEGEESYVRSASVYDEDLKSLAAEQAKLETVRARIKEDFLALETQKKEFDEYRSKTETSLKEQKELLSEKQRLEDEAKKVTPVELPETDTQKSSKVQFPLKQSPAPKSVEIKETPSQVVDDSDLTVVGYSPADIVKAPDLKKQADPVKPSSTRFSPTSSSLGKKRPQYRRFDEAQTKVEDVVTPIPLSPIKQKGNEKSCLTPVTRKEDSKEDIILNKSISKKSVTRPAKGYVPSIGPGVSEPKVKSERKEIKVTQDKPPLEKKLVPPAVIDEKAKGKTLQEFGSVKVEEDEKPLVSKKTKKKVFWGAILVPFVMSAGFIGKKITKSDLPKFITDENVVEVPENNDDALVEEDFFDAHDTASIDKMEKLAQEKFEENVFVDPEVTKMLNESENAADLVANVADDYSVEEGDITSSLNPVNSEEEPVPSYKFLSQLDKAITAAQPLVSDEPNVVLAKPTVERPLHDPQDADESEHIGMLPQLFLD